MSVVKSKRGQGKLLVYTRSNELAVYTIQICANEKHFPKRYRWCITNKLVESALAINNCVAAANAVYIADGDEEAKKTQIFPIRQPIHFLGFSFKLTESGKVLMFVLPNKVTRERRKLKKLVNLCNRGILTREDVDKCFEAWKAHAAKGNSYNLIKSMEKYYTNLWKEQSP